jgi:hypothetical protein
VDSGDALLSPKDLRARETSGLPRLRVGYRRPLISSGERTRVGGISRTDLYRGNLICSGLSNDLYRDARL